MRAMRWIGASSSRSPGADVKRPETAHREHRRHKRNCKARKGARSYYPLCYTVAQTGQVFDVLHRAGNEHDSRGAQAFATACRDHTPGDPPQRLVGSAVG
jgi:hypothetical protein